MKPYCLEPCRSVRPLTDVTCCVDETGRAWTCEDDDGNKKSVDFYPGSSKIVDTFSFFKTSNEDVKHNMICSMFGLKLGMSLHGTGNIPFPRTIS